VSFEINEIQSDSVEANKIILRGIPFWVRVRVRFRPHHPQFFPHFSPPPHNALSMARTEHHSF